MKPKISVVVTTFNRSTLLKETINSILNQTFLDFELIIVDNFSDYDFYDLINFFEDTRIRAFQNKNHGIIAKNRNYGMSLAMGDFIALCDDDDIWMPTKLADQLKIMDRNHKISIISTSFDYFKHANNKSKISKVQDTLRNYILGLNILPVKYILLFIPFIANSSVMIRKNILNSTGFFNENPLLVTLEDYDYWFRICQTKKYFYLNKKLLKYRIHNNQISNFDKISILKKWKLFFLYNNASFNVLQKLIFKLFYKL